jgi:hypothetical protein
MVMALASLKRLTNVEIFPYTHYWIHSASVFLL